MTTMPAQVASQPVEPPAPTRVRADSRPVIRTVLWLVGLLAVVSFGAGVPGLLEVGRWADLPGIMPIFLPLMLDGGLIVFALVATVRRARLETARFAWTWLTVLTLASAGAQVAHVVVASDGAVTVQAVVGSLVAALFPLVVFAATHSLLDLAIAPAPTRRGNRRPAPAARASSTPRPASRPSSASPAARGAGTGRSAARSGGGSRAVDEAAMARAIELVVSGGMSQRAAALEAGVSRSSLGVAMRSRG